MIDLAQTLTHLCLAFIAGLDFLICACFLVDGDREMTKSSVAELTYLISFFTARLFAKN